MIDRGHLPTEQHNPKTARLDAASTADAFDLLNTEDAQIAGAVAAAKAEIVRAVELIAAGMQRGGRLIYIGAGTSGRLGVLDAAECPPTFLIEPDRVVGVIAGGPPALLRSAEHCEDSPAAGAEEMDKLQVGANDTAFGIATGGTTPYVHGALQRARTRGAQTVFLACVPAELVPDKADVSIRVVTGPEVLSGSTRLKAGLATKMVLNTVSTLVMVRLGKVYGNLMVDVNARGCAKLTDRAVRITMQATGLARAGAQALLERADWHVKRAIAMHQLGLTREQAQSRLARHGGNLRQALEAVD